MCSKYGLCLSQHMLSNRVFYRSLCSFFFFFFFPSRVWLIYLMWHIFFKGRFFDRRDTHSHTDHMRQVTVLHYGAFISRMPPFMWIDLFLSLCALLPLLSAPTFIPQFSLLLWHWLCSLTCKQDLMSFYVCSCAVGTKRPESTLDWGGNQVNHQYRSLSCTIMADIHMDDVYCYSDDS